MTRNLEVFQSTFLMRVNETFLAELDALCRVQPTPTTRSSMIRQLVAEAAANTPALIAERAQAEAAREQLIKELRIRVKGVPRHVVDARIEAALQRRADSPQNLSMTNPRHLGYVGGVPGSRR